MFSSKLVKSLFFLLIVSLMSASCVSSKKFKALEEERGSLQSQLADTKKMLKDCDDMKADLMSTVDKTKGELKSAQDDLKLKNQKITQLNDQLDFVKTNNSNLLERLEDLSIISKSGAESIKTSLASMNDQNQYIRSLTKDIKEKDSLNVALMMTLKRSLADINDDDIQIEVREGVVFVSISDKLLFRSGSSRLSTRAREVLGKVAKVVNDHGDLNITVEGHTDDDPINAGCVTDNWDLSVNRATAVVRELQKKHGVDPSRMTAAGRSEYSPKATNESKEGKELNRRTEIMITPRMDEFFKLLSGAAK
jgi:chemotaxis protein MotB